MAHSNSDSQSTGAINAEQVCEPNFSNTNNGRRWRREIRGAVGDGRFEFHGEDEQMAHAMRGGLQIAQHEPSQKRAEGNASVRTLTPDTSWWSSEPNVGRVANGVASRVDRLKAIGNGQVPAVAATAFQLLSEGL